MGFMKDWGAPILVAVVSGFTSFLAGVYGTQVNKEVENRKLDIQMVEIALNLLRSDSEDAKLRSARAFAIQALKRYSGITDLTEIQWREWETTGTVPKLPTMYWWGSAEPGSPLDKLLLSPFIVPDPETTAAPEPGT